MVTREDIPPSATLQEVLQWGTAELEQADVPDASLDAWYLLEHVTQLSRAAYFLRQSEGCRPEHWREYREYIRKRKERIPLQHLTGVQEFMGMPFQVNSHVLIPRQDTECLVERVLPLVKKKRVLDVCTGSGCIAISIAKLGEPALTDAVDISEEALAVARNNAKALQAEVTFRQSDLLEAVTERYDVIVSNPPYIPPEVIETLMPEVKCHEPYIALDGGADGLDFYRRIACQAAEALETGGALFLEIGDTQGADVTDILCKAGYDRVQVHLDLSGRERVVQACNNKR